MYRIGVLVAPLTGLNIFFVLSRMTIGYSNHFRQVKNYFLCIFYPIDANINSQCSYIIKKEVDFCLSFFFFFPLFFQILDHCRFDMFVWTS